MQAVRIGRYGEPITKRTLAEHLCELGQELQDGHRVLARRPEHVAAIALQEFADRVELGVPGDLSIVGFDDVPMAI